MTGTRLSRMPIRKPADSRDLRVCDALTRAADERAVSAL